MHLLFSYGLVGITQGIWISNWGLFFLLLVAILI